MKWKLIIAGSIVTLVVAAYFVVPWIPGTLRVNGDGTAWGTGIDSVPYSEGGSPRWQTHYIRGQLKHAEWFTPDGSLIHECNVASGDYEWPTIRPDGSIGKKQVVRDGVPIAWVYYNLHGREIDEAAWTELESARFEQTLKGSR